MIPGKQYKPEDYLAILWRRKWWAIIPLLLVAAGTVVYSQRLPNRYRSSALVLVVPPKVPANVVKPVANQPLQERLAAMQQQILSRTNLERIILELNLYPEERKTVLMDQVVEGMRRDVSVTPQRVSRRQQPNNFTVTYASADPHTAMRVTERLASLFIRENLEGRTLQTDVMNRFLQRQLDESLRRLQEHEAQVQAFRTANAGRLPSEAEDNLSMAQDIRNQLQSLNDSITRDRERQDVIARTLTDETTAAALAPPQTAAPSGEGAGAGTPAQQLATARSQLASLELRLTPDHPDVRALKRRIGELAQKASDEALLGPMSEVAGTAGPADRARQNRISQLRTQQETLERDIARKRNQSERLQGTLQTVSGRIAVAPAIQAKFTDLMRGYSTLQAAHADLLQKAEVASLGTKLEEQQVGEQFQLIDPARLPDRPSSPDRLRMNLMGSLAGLALGLTLVGLLEYRDTSLRTADDVLVALSLPVVAVVPTIWTDKERRRNRRRKLLWLGSSVAATVVLSFAVLAWKLRLLENWGR